MNEVDKSSMYLAKTFETLSAGLAGSLRTRLELGMHSLWGNISTCNATYMPQRRLGRAHSFAAH